MDVWQLPMPGSTRRTPAAPGSSGAGARIAGLAYLRHTLVPHLLRTLTCQRRLLRNKRLPHPPAPPHHLEPHGKEKQEREVRPFSVLRNFMQQAVLSDKSTACLFVKS